MTESPLSFRAASPGEADVLRDFVRAAYARWVPIIGREPRPMQADYALALRQHEFEIACRDDQMLGLIETVLRDDHLWIENIAIAPDAQGRGLGTLLMQRAEARALAAGRSEARLVTNARMDINIALYRRRGYSIEREEPFLNGMAIHMHKVLA